MVASLNKPASTLSAEPKKKRSIWNNVVAVIACQIVAILAVEFVLSVSGFGEEEIFRFDKEIGFLHIPNKKITWRTEGFATSQFDSDGMRESGLTVAKPANTVRVALLGDSLVEGLQVPIEQTFGQQIQKELSPIGNKQLQVLNFGTSGYSTVQEYLQLKRQVMKYQPDLVLLCYNNRDLFENWSPPDQVITNVRPAAIHLPGGKLILNNSQVLGWWKSPRGRFLTQIEWLREHSRIYGLYAALDLEWSMHNPWYRALLDAFAHPKKAINEFKAAFAGAQQSGPSFNIQFFEGQKAGSAGQGLTFSSRTAASPQPTGATPSVTPVANPTKPATPAVAASANSPAKPSGTSTYCALVQRTFGSLLSEMNHVCTAGGAKLAVVAMPARGALSPFPNVDTTFAGMDYSAEIGAVQEVCNQQSVPFFNCEAAAERVAPQDRPSLFYTVHLTPKGQTFVADQLRPFVQQQLLK